MLGLFIFAAGDFYRIENAMEDAEVHVAVVVQKMVNADIAGVIFSVHPVTKDTNQMIIEAGFGLGEALVSGQITPDNYIVHKDSLDIVDTYIGHQKLKIQRDRDGKNETVELNSEQGSLRKLTDDQVKALAQETLLIEKHYGFPVDIEWAMEDGKVYITQARPITTL